MNETTWKFLSPLNSSAGNLSTPAVAQKFPPFQCCFRRSNEVPRLLVLFRNYRLIIGPPPPRTLSPTSVLLSQESLR